MIEVSFEDLAEILQWEIFPPREALPICSTTRHTRVMNPAVFEVTPNPLLSPIEGDLMLKDNGTYYIAFHVNHDKSRITWKLKKNV